MIEVYPKINHHLNKDDAPRIVIEKVLVSGVQQSDLVIHIYICIYILFHILFYIVYYKILNIQYIEY